MRSARSRISTHSEPISWIIRLCSVVPERSYRQHQSQRSAREMFHEELQRLLHLPTVHTPRQAPTTEYIHQPLPLKLALSREMTCACRAEWEASSIASSAT
jgi:hypothetical protein